MRFLFIFLFLVSATRIGFSADLVGTVKEKSGEPIANATVNVSTARMRSGSSPVCPSCWADCRKSAHTDAQGSFRISDVSDGLVFQLLVSAEGFAPKFMANVDPQKGPISVTLERRNIGATDTKHSIRGEVVDSNGNPIAGASVEPDFSQKGLDPLALTDAKGEFLLISANPVEVSSFTIRAEGFAPTKINTSRPNAGPLKIVLTRGATIAGRVLKDGKPIGGVRVGAAQTSRSLEDFLGSFEARTDANGKFEIAHVPANQEMAVYGIMDSLIGKGAIPVHITKSGADDSIDDLGDISVQKGLKIVGQLRVSGGKGFPPGTRVHVGREVAWDWQLVDVKPDGSFEVDDFPAGEGIEIGTPRNHEIQKVSGGFKIDGLNNHVQGVTSGEMPPVIIDLVEKDERTKLKEFQMHIVTELYAPFFQSQRLSAEQRATFIELKISDEKAAEAEMSAGKSGAAVWREAKTKFPTDLRQKLGPEIADAYVRFELERMGQQFADAVLPQGGKSLTPQERDALALALGRVMDAWDAENAEMDYDSLSREQAIARITRGMGRLREAGEKVLPESKHAEFEQGLEKAKAELIAGIPPQAKQ